MEEDSNQTVDGHGPLDGRAYEVAEERQREREGEGKANCSWCHVHKVFKNRLCVHCYLGKTGPTPNNIKAREGNEGDREKV